MHIHILMMLYNNIFLMTGRLIWKDPEPSSNDLLKQIQSPIINRKVKYCRENLSYTCMYFSHFMEGESVTKNILS